jgi:hypothetical protein
MSIQTRTIAQLAAAEALTVADVVAVDDGATTRKATVAQLRGVQATWGMQATLGDAVADEAVAMWLHGGSNTQSVRAAAAGYVGALHLGVFPTSPPWTGVASIRGRVLVNGTAVHTTEPVAAGGNGDSLGVILATDDVPLDAGDLVTAEAVVTGTTGEAVIVTLLITVVY